VLVLMSKSESKGDHLTATLQGVCIVEIVERTLVPEWPALPGDGGAEVLKVEWGDAPGGG
jgi:hypothetical protein